MHDDSQANKNGHSSSPLSPIIPGRSGRPRYSLEALRERIEQEFQDETASRADILLDLDTEDKRRDMLREVIDYLLAVESITLSGTEKAALLDKTYRNLFSFGPLDSYLADDNITEITVNGPADIHARYGLGKMQSIPVEFDDRAHLHGILERVLATAGRVMSEADPFVETGVVLLGRPARVTVLCPPVSPDYSLTIRLHPRQPHPLEALVPPQAAALLQAILRGGYGLLIVGDVSMGKTTLAAALAATLPPDAAITAVERSAEMHLPAEVQRRSDQPGADFVTQIQAALDDQPDWLLIDEIRGDESAAVWNALTRPDAPHYLWVFRGTSQPDRLRSALSMVIRKQFQTVDQRDIHRALARHLPFVVAYKPHQIAEWVLDESADTLTLSPLLSEHESGWRANRSMRELDLPDDFWP